MADMIGVDEAIAIVLGRLQPLAAESLNLADSLLGRVLAEDIFSDLDSPPFDKAMMDGYAVCSTDLSEGRAELRVIEEVMAGRVPSLPVASGHATRIMTGAPIPAGADAVIPIERARLEGDRVHIEDRPPKHGSNIMPLGREMRRGDKVLSVGDVVRPVEMGVLAAVGQTRVRVVRVSQVAVLSTGDEIVEAPTVPGPGQIRNSNGPMLSGLVRTAGGLPRYLGNARDHLDSLRPMIQKGLEHDALILCGGVSAGKADLVPGVLREAGVEAHFHKVAMKPGKPVFFGTLGNTVVFGLPGNPVSALACFELFVRPALRRLNGYTVPGPHFVNVPLAEEFSYKSDRPTYYPSRMEKAAVGWQIRRVEWFGSPDLRGLTRANALMLLQAGDHSYRVGQSVAVLVLDR